MLKKVYKALPAIIFSGFLLMMLVLFIVLPKKEYSASEKRYLAKSPEFTWENLLAGSFGKEFKTFLEDQTPARNLWVGVGAYYNYLIGNNGTSGIYKGFDGYLINDPQDMTDLMTNVGYINECAQHISVPTAVLVAPSTGYVCEDELPRVHLSYHDDMYFEKMADTLTAANFIDLRDTFRQEHAAGNQIYYKTDHHWTAYGAYTAYRALADTLGYTPLDRSAYAITAYDGFYGTTYSGSGYWLNPADQIEVWDNRANDGDLHVTISDGDEKTEQDDMFFYRHLDEDDKYPVYLDGNHPYTEITNRNASSDETLLVVKDSFAHSLVPFLADHYAKIVMVDMRYYHNPIPYLAQKAGADRVLFVYSIDNLAIDEDIKWIE